MSKTQSTYVIKIKNLNFGFTKKELVLNGLNISVSRGSIYGFLGANGAGKTTTIRLLLGLLENNNKSIWLFDEVLEDNRINILSKIGSLIEQPSLYEHLSGHDNLEITRQIRQVSKHRIPEVLNIVGLSDAGSKKVRAYSVGMKQRLGLAIALLAEPEMLILDEPVSGLDPCGIVEIRELLIKLNKEFGITIFLSTHLLSEIEKMVTHIGIIKGGQLVFEGSIEELQNFQKAQPVIQITVNDIKRAIELLSQKYTVVNTSEFNLEVLYTSKEQVAAICELLVKNGINVYDLHTKNNNLEDIFLEITKK
jgi:lantibiotic transport system ATP-binding protein